MPEENNPNTQVQDNDLSSGSLIYKALSGYEEASKKSSEVLL